MSIIDDEARPFATLFVISILFILALFRIFKHRILGGIARSVSVFEVICFTVFIFATCLPFFVYNVESEKHSALDNTTARLEVVVEDVYSETEYYSSFLARVRAVNLENADFSVTVFTPFPAEVKENDIIVFDSMLSKAVGNATGFSESYFKRNNILFSAEASSDGFFLCLGEETSPLTRLSAQNRRAGYMLDFRLSPKASALAKALVLGDREYLTDVLNRDFSRIGISHLLALSGMHLALILGLYTLIARRLIPSRLILSISVIPITIFIYLFAGPSASLLRAALALIIGSVGYIIGRKPDPMTVLFLIAFILFAADPRSVFDIGLILSLSSVFGILLLMPAFGRLKASWLGRRRGGFIIGRILPIIYDSVTLSFSACAFTLPAMFFFFDVASLISIISTLIFTPLIVGYIILSLLVLVFYKIQPACAVVSKITENLYEVIENLSEWISSFENVAVSSHLPVFRVAFGIMISALVIAVFKNSLRQHFAILTLAAHVSLAAVALAAVLLGSDVGDVAYMSQSNDYTFLISSDKAAAVIDVSDGGTNSAERAANLLFESFKTEADLILITHYGAGHHLMLKRLNSYLPIKNILLPTPTSEREEKYASSIKSLAAENNIAVDFFDRDKELDISGFTVQVLSSNNSPFSHKSVSVSLRRAQRDILILDSSADIEADKNLSRLIGRADVVYLCAHTSGTPAATDIFGRDTLVFSP